ncbi:1 TM domain-containing transmembrane protein [Acrasis kona]|uniref:1 TM domain-containing transmembrane protein n=1 Tax=Acrasis kona TaxID=1008807 RepID=A0AAW2ZDV1_9EUKA
MKIIIYLVLFALLALTFAQEESEEPMSTAGPTTSSAPTTVAPTQRLSTSAPTTSSAPTTIAPTQRPSTSAPTTAAPTTSSAPTTVAPTQRPSTSAPTTSNAPTTTSAPLSTSQQEALKPNLQVLNYALTLEHLEATFYRQGLQQFSEADVIAAGYSAQVRDYISVVADHEATHVSTLTSVIKSLGGVPVEECTYNFGYGNNFTTFLQVADALENTGVSAYDGAAQLITNKDILTAAATIATVEARHAAYLNTLVGMNPFPQAFDTPLNMSQVLAIAGPFITSCPAINSQCNGVSADNSNVCSGRGVCSFTVCTCNRGFEGFQCNVAATPSPSCPVTSSAPTATTRAPVQSTSKAPNANESGDDNSRESSGAGQITSVVGLIVAVMTALLL